MSMSSSGYLLDAVVGALEKVGQPVHAAKLAGSAALAAAAARIRGAADRGRDGTPLVQTVHVYLASGAIGDFARPSARIPTNLAGWAADAATRLLARTADARLGADETWVAASGAASRYSKPGAATTGRRIEADARLAAHGSANVPCLAATGSQSHLFWAAAEANRSVLAVLVR
jgi:hypothetical protein